VKLEAAAKEYHVLPRAGGLFDQCAWIMDAFAAVRIAQADFYLWKMKKAPKTGGRK